MIRAYLKGEQTDWDLNLGCLGAAYRSTPQESTGMTPNLLMLGREVRIPAEITFSNSSATTGENVSSYGEYVEKLKENMQKAHDIARQNLHAATKKQKDIYDLRQLTHIYQQGEVVWYLNVNRKEGVCPKLQMPYDGPAIIVKKLSILDYVIQIDASGKLRVLHHNRLKPYTSDHKPKWILRALKKKRS